MSQRTLEGDSMFREFAVGRIRTEPFGYEVDTFGSLYNLFGTVRSRSLRVGFSYLVNNTLEVNGDT